jgi:poly-gamma-glutamate capsule biosynthesis protein CapA/YwtB (metallophosphatase superfamily)
MNRIGRSIGNGWDQKVDKENICTIIIAGDLYPSVGFQNMVSNTSSESYKKIRSIIRASDLALVNLECPLTESKGTIIKSGPHLRGSSNYAKFIREMGFNIVNLANNHILDMGERGIYDTLKACDKVGLKTLGAGVDLKHAVSPLIFNFDNYKVGILSFAEQEFSIATESSAGAAPLDLVDNYYQIRDLHKKVDFVLVILHVGNEYYMLPRPGLVKICRFLIESGAGGIVCHHPHVPGGIEVYKKSPIFYSIGNFYFEWTGKPLDWYQGYLVRLLISNKKQIKFEIVPYYQCLENSYIKIMDNNEKSKFDNKIKDLSNIIMNNKKIIDEWNKYCLKEKIPCLHSMFGLNKIERGLFKRGLWPFWKIRHDQLKVLLNYVRCESLKEVCVRVLEEIIKTRKY